MESADKLIQSFESAQKPESQQCGELEGGDEQGRTKCSIWCTLAIDDTDSRRRHPKIHLGPVFAGFAD